MAVSRELRARVEAKARFKCGYCLCQKRYVYSPLEIDHLVPTALGGGDEEENLWLACRFCNSSKATQTHGMDPGSGSRVPLFNPRQQVWSRHFCWSEDGLRIVGKTRCGRATVEALRLNQPIAVAVRSQWVQVGWHPPKRKRVGSKS